MYMLLTGMFGRKRLINMSLVTSVAEQEGRVIEIAANQSWFGRHHAPQILSASGGPVGAKAVPKADPVQGTNGSGTALYFGEGKDNKPCCVLETLEQIVAEIERLSGGVGRPSTSSFLPKDAPKGAADRWTTDSVGGVKAVLEGRIDAGEEANRRAGSTGHSEPAAGAGGILQEIELGAETSKLTKGLSKPTTEPPDANWSIDTITATLARLAGEALELGGGTKSKTSAISLVRRETVKQLDELDAGDREVAHGEADNLLLRYLRATGSGEIADAWKRARKRTGFWYT